MSISSVSSVSVHECKWDWCRETFVTGDRLAKHVMDDHVAKEKPIKKEEIRLELRAFDGASIGEENSIPTSLLMNEYSFLGGEEKGCDVASNGVTSQLQQETVEEEERLPDPNNVPSSIVEVQGPSSPLAEQDTPAPGFNQQTPVLPQVFRTPRSSPSPGFRALADASSCSPDPRSMAVAPSPSIAEIIANTINNAHASNRWAIAGQSSAMLESPVQRSKLPRSPLPGQNIRPPSSQGKRKSAEAHFDGVPRPASRSCARTPSNVSDKVSQRSNGESTALSPISEHAVTPESQDEYRSETQNSQTPASSARPFRTGSLRLEPNVPLERSSDEVSSVYDKSVPVLQSHTQSESQTRTGATDLSIISEPDRPHSRATNNGTDVHMEDMQTLSSSIAMSIPAFTQTFDVQNQSQWPLATQAPYSFDSQLTSTSQ